MAMAMLVVVPSVLAFAVALYYSGVAQVARLVTATATGGVSAMTNPEFDDDQKEAAVRKAGLKLIALAWSVIWRFALILLAAYVPIFLADQIGLASAADVMALMLRPDVIIIISVVMIAAVWLYQKWARKGAPDAAVADTTVNNYSSSDRLVHMLAFSGPTTQKACAAIDDLAFSLVKKGVETEPPVFVTSLARGGTTALLNALDGLDDTVIHRYRDMPFLTAPILWHAVNAPFDRKVERTQRAHGDGLEIDLDSPEAFDEVYWRLFWPKKYAKSRIALWSKGDTSPKATRFFETIFRKIAYVRGKRSGHYVSKNNANIARLRVLPDMFPGCQIVIPLRRPATHAASLLRQHLNFKEQHAKDDFTRRYMYDIDHLEFGALHNPIAFPGFDPTVYALEDPNYWLAYWIAGFEEVRANIDHCRIVLQDDLRDAPNETMQALLSQTGLAPSTRDFRSYYRAAPDRTDESVFAPDLLAQANAIYEDLARYSVLRR